MIDPYLLFEKAQLRPGMHMADLGCGKTGHLVFPAAKIVGEQGVIYAVDILKDVLEAVHKRSMADNFLNIHTVWTNLEHVGAAAIPEKTLDVAFLINVLVHSDNRHGILEEAKRLLKDKARLIIVDWAVGGNGFGPETGRFVDFENIKGWGKLHGLAFQEDFSVGKYHRGLVFFKQE